ncbi:MAG TPA: bifunctional nuclease family protein [Limnochordia bacterium]|nr:bifunctional nuclease family protein [Limnochordia bacterium]
MKVKVVGVDQHHLRPVVVITDTEEKGYMPILIGDAEAKAIRRALAGEPVPRPMTHDLFKDVLDSFGAKVEKVVIHDLKDETYFARIYLRTRDGLVDIDARPSDAIAVSLRTNAPIFVSEDVAAQALIANGPVADDELETFRRFLDKLTPEDFERNLSAGE